MPVLSHYAPDTRLRHRRVRKAMAVVIVVVVAHEDRGEGPLARPQHLAVDVIPLGQGEVLEAGERQGHVTHVRCRKLAHIRKGEQPRRVLLHRQLDAARISVDAQILHVEGEVVGNPSSAAAELDHPLRFVLHDRLDQLRAVHLGPLLLSLSKAGGSQPIAIVRHTTFHSRLGSR